MFRQKCIENRGGGVKQISNVAWLACLIFGVVFSASSAEQVSIKFAPILFSATSGGYVGYNLVYTVRDHDKSTSQSANLTVNYGLQAYSFIWQPWLARVNAGVLVGVNQGISNDSTSSSNKSTGASLGGNVAFNLIPFSRTPIGVSFSRTNGRNKTGLNSTTSSTRVTRLGLEQGYRARVRSTYERLSLNHVLNEGTGLAPSTRDSVTLAAGHQPFHLQQIELEARFEREYRPALDSRISRTSLIATHGYAPNKTFSVGNIFNAYKGKSLNSGISSDSSFQQFQSSGRWSAQPLSVSASLRLNSNSQNRTSSNINFSGSYRFSPWVQGSGVVNVADSQGVQNISTGMSLNASKLLTNANTIKIGGISYKRYVTGALTSQTSSVSQSDTSQTSRTSQGLSVGVGHSLVFNSKLYGQSLVSQASQSTGVGFSLGGSGAAVATLSTSASTTWSAVTRERGSSLARLSVSDLRPLHNSNQRVSQLLNLQITRKEELGRSQSLVGHITLQATRQGSSLESQGSHNFSAGSDLYYTRTRVFNVPHLIFASSLKIQEDYSSSTLPQKTAEWENNMAYTLGKMQLNLDSRISKYNNASLASLSFRMLRTF